MRTMLIRLAAAGAATGAALAARQAAEAGWRMSQGTEPPTLRDPDADLREVVIWTATVAGAVYVAKRLASSATQRALGPTPVDAT